jgi:hypothetical protein
MEANFKDLGTFALMGKSSFFVQLVLKREYAKGKFLAGFTQGSIAVGA